MKNISEFEEFNDFEDNEELEHEIDEELIHNDKKAQDLEFDENDIDIKINIAISDKRIFRNKRDIIPSKTKLGPSDIEESSKDGENAGDNNSRDEIGNDKDWKYRHKFIEKLLYLVVIMAFNNQGMNYNLKPALLKYLNRRK